MSLFTSLTSASRFRPWRLLYSYVELRGALSLIICCSAPGMVTCNSMAECFGKYIMFCFLCSMFGVLSGCIISFKKTNKCTWIHEYIKCNVLHSYIQVHCLVFYKFFNRVFYNTFSLFCKRKTCGRFFAFFRPVNIVLGLIHLIHTTFRKLM